ncbi:hypothetical protein P9112_003617 [Eukaryota sp. TZLM1-RC]
MTHMMTENGAILYQHGRNRTTIPIENRGSDLPFIPVKQDDCSRLKSSKKGEGRNQVRNLVILFLLLLHDVRRMERVKIISLSDTMSDMLIAISN